jgi:hypothetical protein
MSNPPARSASIGHKFLVALGVLFLPLGASISVVAMIHASQSGISSSCVTTSFKLEPSLMDWIIAPRAPVFDMPDCDAHFALSMLWDKAPIDPMIRFFIGPGVMFLGTVMLSIGFFGTIGNQGGFSRRGGFMRVQCRHCGAMNERHDRFCGQCGQPTF